MFTWRSLEQWSDCVRIELNDAVGDYERKAAGIYREITHQQRPISVTQATFTNGISPKSESHVLMLEPFWHTLDLIDNRETIHAIARQLDLLVAPIPDYSNTEEGTLFGAFTSRNEEWVQTQTLVRAIIEKQIRCSTLSAREKALKEIYEDFCESLSLMFKLEKAYLATVSEAAVCSGQVKPESSWSKRYGSLESCVVSKLKKLAADGSANDVLSSRVIGQALASKGAVQLSAPNFLRLMFLDKDRDLAARFLESLGYGMGPQPKLEWHAAEGDLISMYAELESRQAGTAAKIKDALKDREISRTELDQIYEELVEEHQAQVQLVMAAGILKAPDQSQIQPS